MSGNEPSDGPPPYVPPAAGPPPFVPPAAGPPPFGPLPFGPPQLPPSAPPTPFLQSARFDGPSQADVWRAELEREKQRRRKRRRHRNLLTVGAFLVVVLMCGGVVVWLGRQQEYTIVDGDVVMYAAGDQSDPPPADDATASPLNTPAVQVAPAGNYDFLYLQPDSSPVAWDPCQPVHFIVNHAEEPPGGARELDAALAAVSTATGLQFIDDGSTDEVPSLSRRVVDGTGADRRWTPVLIAWTSESGFPQLADDVVGIGIPRRSVSRSTGLARHVSGTVVLDGPDLGEVIRQFGGEGARGIIEHELGHLLGLGHVNDPGQLMNPSTDLRVNDLQSGDLAGLSLLGHGRCFDG